MRWQAHVPLRAARRTGGNDIHIDILIQLNLNVADATSRKRVILRSLVITSEKDGSIGPSRNTWNDVEMLIVPASTWGWGLWEQDGDSMDASCFVVSVLQKNSTRVRRKGEWTDDEIPFSERKGGLKIPANILKHFFLFEWLDWNVKKSPFIHGKGWVWMKEMKMNLWWQNWPIRNSRGGMEEDDWRRSSVEIRPGD